MHVLVVGAVGGAPAAGPLRRAVVVLVVVQEAKSVLLCPSREKMNTAVLKGGGNISDTLQNPPMKFLV